MIIVVNLIRSFIVLVHYLIQNFEASLNKITVSTMGLVCVLIILCFRCKLYHWRCSLLLFLSFYKSGQKVGVCWNLDACKTVITKCVRMVLYLEAKAADSPFWWSGLYICYDKLHQRVSVSHCHHFSLWHTIYINVLLY